MFSTTHFTNLFVLDLLRYVMNKAKLLGSSDNPLKMMVGE